MDWPYPLGKNHLHRFVATALVVGLAACDGGNTPAPPPGGAVSVSVLTLEPQPIMMTVELPGRTSAHKVAEIRPQVSGIIKARLFDEGGLVKAGQQLYQIDDAAYVAALARAEAELQRAQAAATIAEAHNNRFADLVKNNSVSRQDYEETLANYEQAIANVAVAEASRQAAAIDLQYTKVNAPIDGRIGISHVTEGALVTANQEQVLSRITQLDPIYVDMPQSSKDFIALRKQLSVKDAPVKVELLLEGLNQTYQHTGTLQSSDITVDTSTGAVQLRALFPNPDHELLPGLFVKARIVIGEQQSLLVPQRAAARNADGKLQVWRVMADNTAAPTFITTSGTRGDQWVVSSGLTAGDTIVIEGYQKLSPGASLSTTPFNAPATATRSSTGLPQTAETN